MTSSQIRLNKIKKDYGKVTAVSEFNLTVNSGERMVLLGPSGCGKTTVLRMVAGLESITAGELYLGERLANDLEPGERNIAMVFQNYALYPHLTVWENVAFGLEIRHTPKKEIDERIKNALTMLNLTGFESRKPKELSGGQRQRVALARALVKQAPFFLLDEPLSNLDAQLRAHARSELVRLHQHTNSTMIYVTHDQIEAMTIGQRIAVMAKGVLQQVDKPGVIYRRPANTFVAKFIGNPPMNLMRAVVNDGQLIFEDNIVLSIPQYWREYLGTKNVKDVLFGIRPESIILSNANANIDTLPVAITWQEDCGNQKLCYLNVGSQNVIAVIDTAQRFTDGLVWNMDWSQVHFFDQKSESNLGYPKQLEIR